MKALISILFLSLIVSTQAGWNLEEKKINFLIQEIEKVEGTFVRNGDEHTPSEAAKHLRMKLKNALNSWFTPSKEKWTADLFIEKVASKSSLSGTTYKIKLDSGKVVTTSSWLKNKLLTFKNKPIKSHLIAP